MLCKITATCYLMLCKITATCHLMLCKITATCHLMFCKIMATCPLMCTCTTCSYRVFQWIVVVPTLCDLVGTSLAGQSVIMLTYNLKLPMVVYSSAKLQSPPLSGLFFWLCDKVYHKQEVHILLYFLGQRIT